MSRSIAHVARFWCFLHDTAMPRLALLLTLVILTSCGERMERKRFVPTHEQISSLELRLSANPCTSDLRYWSRTYYVDPEQPNHLEFGLAKGDGKSVTPGIKVIPTITDSKVILIEDADTKVALGSYDLAEKKLDVAYCGPNRVQNLKH